MSTTPVQFTHKYDDYPLVSSLSVQTGMIDTTYIETNLKPLNVAEEVFLLTRASAPFTYLSRTVRKTPSQDVQFRWFEDDIVPSAVKGDGTNDPGTGTSIILDTNYGKRVRVNDILWEPDSGERMLVTGVSGDTLTVTRDLGSFLGTPASLVSTLQYMIIGNAMAEGTGAPSTIRTIKRTYTNYLSILKRALTITGTELAIKQFGGPELAYQEKKLLIEYAIDIEKQFLFGVPSEDTSGSTPQRTTGGLLYFLNWKPSTPTADCPLGNMTTWSLQSLMDWFKEVYYHQPEKPRYLLASPDFISWFVTQVGTNTSGITVFRNQENKTFGLNITNVELPFGSMRLINHPLLRLARAAGSTSTEVWAIAVEPTALEYRYLSANGENREMIRFEQPIPNQNLEDAKRIVYQAEIGFALHTPEKHGILYRTSV